MIKTLLQIVEAFQEPYHSHDASLISIMYAKPDTFDSEDNVACCFLNLTDNACFTLIQMSTLNKIFDKTKKSSIVALQKLKQCNKDGCLEQHCRLLRLTPQLPREPQTAWVNSQMMQMTFQKEYTNKFYQLLSTRSFFKYSYLL